MTKLWDQPRTLAECVELFKSIMGQPNIIFMSMISPGQLSLSCSALRYQLSKVRRFVYEEDAEYVSLEGHGFEQVRLIYHII